MVKLVEPMQEKARTWRLKVEVLKIISDRHIKEVTGDAYISLYKTEDDSLDYSAGDTLLLSNAHWQPIKNAGNPFEYDYAKGNARKGIYLQSFSSPDDVALYGKLRPQSLSAINRLHAWSDRQLNRYIKDTATLGLLQAMILGDEHNFDQTLRQAYADTGVIHIVSISGSHVAMLFLLITWLLFWLRGKYATWVKYGLGVAVIWVYVLMAGAPPSAVRSGVMFSVVALGVLFSKEKQPLNTLFAAAILLLVIEPMWLYTVGFQLSFAAVLSLTLFYEPLHRLWPEGAYLHRWYTKWIPAGIAASLAAEILTAPLVIYYFHNLPLFVVFANLLAALLIGLCALVGGFAILVFSGLPPVANVFAVALEKVVHFFNSAMLLMQGWTFTSWKYLSITFAELLIIYCIIAGIGYARLERKRSAYAVALSAGCLLILLLSVDRYKALTQERLIVYNGGRTAMVERIKAQHFVPILSGDTTESYAAKSAHIGWHSWRKTLADSSAAFAFRGKKILLLPDNSGAALDFPVDVLIIPKSVKGLSVASLKQSFNPKEIVLCGKQSRWYKAVFRDSCRVSEIPLHDVSEKGAFVLE